MPLNHDKLLENANNALLENPDQVIIRAKRFLVYVNIFFLILLTALFFTIKPLYKSQQAKTWPVTNGTVILSEVGHGAHCSSIHFKYKYQFDSKDYVGNNYTFGSPSCDWSDTQAIANQYPVGTNVAVHYNLKDFSESVIIPGKISSEAWVAIIGFSMFLVPFFPIYVCIMWLAIRARKNPTTFNANVMLQSIQTFRDRKNNR